MRLVVARIGKAHGIRGEVTIELRTDKPERRFVPGAQFAVLGGGPGLPAMLTLEAVRDHNGVLLLGFDGVVDRNSAEGLRGVLLEMDVPDESDEPDAWYDHELVGLQAVAPDGTPLGTVLSIEHRPAQDLITLKRPDGARRLVPFVSAIVPQVDVAHGRMVIDAPPGLLDDEA
jgi:16S rRNA processing protein RimM